MKKVGITGLIGSGKSYVCQKMNEHFLVPVYYTDIEAKRIVDNSKEILSKINEKFGPSVFNGDLLNRKALGQIVFKDKDSMQFLNDLIHPEVRKDLDDWFKRMEEEGFQYVLVESAIMYESGLVEKLDSIVLVDASDDVRIQRVMQRDSCTNEMAQIKIKSQEKPKYFDFRIMNDGDTNVLNRKLIELDRRLRLK